MAEPLKKTGPATFTLTYGSTLPFTMLVYDFEIDPIAGLFVATAGSGGTKLATTGLSGGTVTVLGYLTVASAITLLATVYQQETTTSDTAEATKIEILGTTGTGANSGFAANPIVLYGLIERSPIKVSKTAGYVAGMIKFSICGTPV